MSCNAEEIGYFIYNHPVNRLLFRIKNNDMNGKRFMDVHTDFFKEETGWDDNEAIQIQSILYQHNTFQSNEFHKNMDKIMKKTTIQKQVTGQISDVIRNSDIENYIIKQSTTNASMHLVKQLLV